MAQRSPVLWHLLVPVLAIATFGSPAGAQNSDFTFRRIKVGDMLPGKRITVQIDPAAQAAALAALPDIARAAGVEGYSVCPVEVAEHELTLGRLAGAQLLAHDGPGYPDGMRDLPDAPPLLWARGDVALLSRPLVAMVGARNASSLGLRMARRLAETLGEAGQVVVSGLARGIDAEAHRAALATGTVAVMAGGVDVVYPEENARLAAAIAERGCLLSEQPIGLQPQARHFPLRNRLIAGIARAETPEAAKAALDLTNLVYVPLDALDQRFVDLLALREHLGLRSPVNTALRALNPCGARAQVQGVFHPPYRGLQQDGALALGECMRIACATPQQQSFYEPVHPCRRSVSSCATAAPRPRRFTPRWTVTTYV